MFVACIDIGGTFTDLVLYSRQSDLEIFKSPTTPGEFERGFIDVLGVAAASHDMKLGDFLGKMDMLVHGTTVSTNALIEGKVAEAGLICNVRASGYPDLARVAAQARLQHQDRLPAAVHTTQPHLRSPRPHRCDGATRSTS